MYDGKKNVLALEIAGEIPQQRGILRPSAETAASLYLQGELDKYGERSRHLDYVHSSGTRYSSGVALPVSLPLSVSPPLPPAEFNPLQATPAQLELDGFI